ncbi:MAG TPA: response regulator transcription factor [Actinomycetota bacterium]
MARVLIVTDRSDDLLGLARGLEHAGHSVRFGSLTEVAALRPTLAGDPPKPPSVGDAHVAIVDAAKDLSRGRDACRAYRFAEIEVPLLAIVDPDSVDAVGPDWEIDDFVTDAERTGELLARLRLAIGSQVLDSAGTIRLGDLTVDPESYQVRMKGKPLDLTYKEFQLLLYLARRPSRVFSRHQLLQEVWGQDFYGGTRTVDVHVRRLRAKFGVEHESMIVTIRNVGYRLDAERSR